MEEYRLPEREECELEDMHVSVSVYKEVPDNLFVSLMPPS
jgi:hypothetical protein